MDFATNALPTKDCRPGADPTQPNAGPQLQVQIVLSAILGISAFVGFCLLRPRWKSLYAARKRQSGDQDDLPELPDTFFGWMPVLHRVTEEHVLSSAGLDAYVVSNCELGLGLVKIQILTMNSSSPFLKCR
jgi:hypothetical protein